jgi:hypothetical protein
LRHHLRRRRRRGKRTGVIGKQRIAIFTGFDPKDPLELALAAAILGHELRHAEQRLPDDGQELFALEELADETLDRKMADREGDRALYHFKPTEMDADDAAATFLGRRHPDQVAPMLESFDSPWAGSRTPPGCIANSPAKTVAFLFQPKELAEDPARGSDDTTFEERLRQISSAAPRPSGGCVRPAGHRIGGGLPGVNPVSRPSFVATRRLTASIGGSRDRGPMSGEGECGIGLKPRRSSHIGAISGINA